MNKAKALKTKIKSNLPVAQFSPTINYLLSEKSSQSINEEKFKNSETKVRNLQLKELGITHLEYVNEEIEGNS